MSLSGQTNVVSGRRTRKIQKRNKFVLMLNGFMLRDCAHIRRFERQLSRQVGCNYRLNQFSVCVRERACVIGDMSSIYSLRRKNAAFNSANVLLIPSLIVLILMDGYCTITSDYCWLAAVHNYTILFLFLCCSTFRSVSMTLWKLIMFSFCNDCTFCLQWAVTVLMWLGYSG